MGNEKILKLIEYPLVLSLIITIVFGILMMYSASSIVAVTNYDYSSDFFFRSQLNKLFLGVIGLIICIGLPFHIWKKRIVSVCIVIGSFISIGIGSMIGFQSIVNLGGVTGIFPLTGTPLPFISFGGSSLMANLMAMGILINISIFNKKNR
ncbi:hypothetical protein COD67_05000 [Bacillus cereus]|nr:hypothetical protein COI89_00255 [Bacillus cereus]PGU69251.1 hypothetical protein COD67_05000 [Bacillus cereus]